MQPKPTEINRKERGSHTRRYSQHLPSESKQKERKEEKDEGEEEEEKDDEETEPRTARTPNTKLRTCLLPTKYKARALIQGGGIISRA